MARREPCESDEEYQKLLRAVQEAIIDARTYEPDEQFDHWHIASRVTYTLFERGIRLP